MRELSQAALVCLVPHKYSSSVEECEPSAPQHIFRLPFEFDDKFGPWCILLKEDSIKAMGMLKKSYIEAIEKKLIGKVEKTRSTTQRRLWFLYPQLFEHTTCHNLDCHCKQKEINETLQNLVKIHQIYRPRFKDCYRKKLDCELVYSEFSVIKGTNTEIDYISREDYRAMSTKKYPAFCNNRDEIYDLFKKYEKMKALNGDYDSVDRRKKGTWRSIHSRIDIDECQDNQILDFSLILKIFDGVESIMMAGDIAQCIARGSSFRFQDLRALMHKWELDHYMHNGIRTKLFELNINYRSHNGIIQLASSVIDLIKHFFPDSIDHLSRERGEIDGPQPEVYVEYPIEKFLSDFFRTEDHEINCIEFSAEQVIIVRNEEAK
ncbi:6705_t:CDS:2 [Acaulospora morrowiae]|uniref:6705_t:CDS:1 n=1 Tax=Acaulospora morrowiae TaxID=94023 RepID=A0A9N9C890_9GLOM|nr:6705_t:CDS:2 [Acaulospora morrowiae]